MTDNHTIQQGKQSSKNGISSFSIIVIFVCLSLLGIFLVPQLSVKLNPSKKLPAINISYSMYGQSARVVEMEVTSKLEAMLNRVKGVQEISSYSSNGHGSINLRLSKHVDPDIARFEVSTIVRQTWQSLPSGVTYPTIRMSGVSEEVNTTFLSYTVNAPFSPVVIQEYVENNIKPKLSVVKGIDRVDVSGASRMVYKLEYDYRQLQRHKLTVNDIKSGIRSYLTKEFLGFGRVSGENDTDQWIRIALVADNEGAAFDPATIQLKNSDGTIIYLSQVVKCNFEEEDTSSYYRINGLNSIYLTMTAEDGANQLTLSKQVQDLLNEMQLTLPAGYELHLSYNAGEYIQEELKKIYFRSGLTILILLFFVLLVYRNLKYSLLILSSLVVNIAVATILYYLLNLEMQLYSLAGLTISLTLIIDNTIIMSDQIIQRGNRKAFLAILTATLTTIGVLSIIFLMDENVRLNLQDFSLVIIINLAISLLVALFFVPALTERLNIKKRQKKHKKRKLFRRVKNKRALVWFNRAYGAIIFFMYRRRVWFILFLVFAFGLPVFLLPEKIENKTERGLFYAQQTDSVGFWGDLYNNTLGTAFYKEKIKPISDVALGGTMRLFAQKVRNGSYSSGERAETSLHVTASLPNGSTKEQMNVLIQKMERYIAQYEGVRQFETSIQNGQRASIRILFVKEHQRGHFPHQLKSKLIGKSLELGGGSWAVYGVGDGFNNDVKEQAGSSRIKLLGYNYDNLNAIAQAMQDTLLSYRRIKEITIDSKFSWFKNDYKEFVFDLNKERLAQMDIRPMELFNSLTPSFERNSDAGAWVNNGRVEPIRLYSKQAKELDIWNMKNHQGKIENTDKEYKITEIADIEEASTSQEIAKENQQYLLCLQYEYIGSYQQAWNVLERVVDSFNKTIPLGYKAESESQRYWWGDDNTTQYWLLMLVFVIMFFTTSVLFNSLKQPLVIIFIIPVSFIGIFLTFYLFELNFDQGGFAAFILLAGLSVNANIYVLDEYNNIRTAYPKTHPIKAYQRAWNVKIRPIFLTIISTVLGFIPFIVGYKEAFWFPLAVGTIGGLIVSFIAAYFFLPLFMGVGKK